MILDFEKTDVILTVPSSTAQKPGQLFSQNCKHLIIKAPSQSAKYSIQIDYNDGLPFRRIPDSGTFTGSTIKDLDLILAGVYNIYITTNTPGIYVLRFVGVRVRI